MRVLRPVFTFSAMLLLASCIIVPPPKGPRREARPGDPDNPENRPAQVDPGAPPRDQPAEPAPGAPAEPAPAEPVEEPPPPPPAPPKSVNALVEELGPGPWVHLGVKEPGFTTEQGVVQVTRAKGAFSELTLVVAEAGLELSRIEVIFGNGDSWNPKIRHLFKAGSRTRRLDLPGKARYIRQIEFDYTSADKQHKAQLHVFGRQSDLPASDAQAAAPAAPATANTTATAAAAPGAATTTAVATAPAGAVTQNPWPAKSMAELVSELGKDDDWEVLGSREISEGETEISIPVGKDRGQYLFIAIGATGGEFKLLEWVVNFADGSEHSAPVKHTFKTNSLTRRLSFPGGGRRAIDRVRFLVASVENKAAGHIHLFGLKQVAKK